MYMDLKFNEISLSFSIDINHIQCLKIGNITYSYTVTPKLCVF